MPRKFPEIPMPSFKLPFGRALVALVAVASSPAAFSQCVSLATAGSAYTQNFDTLSNTAGSTTNNLTITGWFMTESGGGARDNEQYAVDTGASNTGDTYSYGSAASTDRALGGLQSGTLIPIVGACFTNNTGATLSSLDVAYTGEEWRLGTAARTDQINFELSENATDLVTGTWTGVAALNFVTPNTATTGAKDGNAVANRTALANSIGSLAIANGATFWIRWTDTNASGADDGLSIDDFSLTPQGAAPPPPDLTVTDVSMNEGNAGATIFNFSVNLSAPAGAGGVTFDIATADNSANSGSDYVGQSLNAQTIPAGSSNYAFNVTVNGDTLYEFDENFFVNVTNVTGATVVDGQGQGTIQLDDAEPSLTASVNPSATIIEGNAGTTPVNVVYTLSGLAQDDLTIDLHTANGSADATDFNGFPGGDTFTIPGGNLSGTYSAVTIIGDTTVELDETFNITVDNYFFGGGRRAPTGVTLPDTQITIDNDDVLATYEFSINDVSVTETDAAGLNAVFTVTLTDTTPIPRAPTGGTIASVNYTTTPGTAVAPDDYATTAGTLNFSAAGTQTISVPIVGDLLDEATENFTVVLSGATGATVADDTGLGTITDNDAAPTLSINDVAVAEGNAGQSNATLTVTLSAASGQTVTVTATAADGSATIADGDYAATTAPLSFTPGQLTQTVSVPINGDVNFEPNETLFVNLSAETNATIADGQGQITITNDDSSADLSASITDTPDPVLPGGTITYTVTLTNSGPSNADNAGFSLPLPAGTTFDSLTAPAGWTCTTPAVGANGTVSCSDAVVPPPTLAKMVPGSATFTIVAAVAFSVPPGTLLSTTLSATTTTTDPNGGNNSAPAATLVGTPPQVPPIPALDRFGQLLIALLVLALAAMSLRRHAH
jgi:hypothetical protein